jgi:hypothetical protein
MAVTQTDVNNYLGFIRQELGIYGSKLATMHQQTGKRAGFPKELKLMLLSAYVYIADHYLDKWDDSEDDNFFTVEEFEDIMRHINEICNSFHWLELN